MVDILDKRKTIVDCDEAFTKAGGFGRYQYIISIFLIISSYSCVCYVFYLPYEFLEPPAQCLTSDHHWISCTQQQACSPNTIYVLKNDRLSLLSKFSLYCDEFSQRYIYASYSIGSLVGGILFNSMGDIYGRLIVNNIGMIGMIFSWLALSIVESFESFIFLTGVNGFFVMATNPAMAFTYESAHSEYIPFFSTFWQVSYALCEIVVAGVSALQLSWYGSLWIHTILVMSYFFLWPMLRETVKYLLTKGQAESALTNLHHIAAINRHPLPFNLRLRLSEKERKSNAGNLSLIDLVKNKMLFSRTINILALSFIMNLVYYGMTINIGGVGGNVYLNGAMNGLSEAISCAVAGYISLVLSRKEYLVIGFVMSAVGCFAQKQLDNVILECALVYAGRFGISAVFIVVYVYCGEAYPSSISTSAIGVSFIAGTISNIVGAFIGTRSESVFMIYGVVALLGCLPSIFLPNIEENIDYKEALYLEEIRDTKIVRLILGEENSGTQRIDHYEEFIKDYMDKGWNIRLHSIEIVESNHKIYRVEAKYALCFQKEKYEIRKEIQGSKIGYSAPQSLLELDEDEKIRLIRYSTQPKVIDSKFQKVLSRIELETTSGKSLIVGDSTQPYYEYNICDQQIIAIAATISSSVHCLEFYLK